MKSPTAGDPLSGILVYCLRVVAKPEMAPWQRIERRHGWGSESPKSVQWWAG